MFSKLIAVAVVLMIVTGCATAPNSDSTKNEDLLVASEESAVSEETPEAPAESPRWKIKTDGYIYFPLFETPIMSGPDWPTDRPANGLYDSDILVRSYLPSAVGAWYDGPLRMAREIEVLGFEGNSLRVHEAGDSTQVWYVPLSLMDIVVQDSRENDENLEGGQITLQAPSIKFAYSAELLDVERDGDCVLITSKGETISALPVLCSWYWEAETPNELRVLFTSLRPRRWPLDRFDSERTDDFARYRLIASRIE